MNDDSRSKCMASATWIITGSSCAVIKEIMGVKEKPDIIDTIENKRLQWHSHVKRTPEERILKLIMGWKPEERRKTCIEEV
jgi:hypothetical protein